MISREQLERAEREFSAAAKSAFGVAHEAERVLELYPDDPRHYDPAIRSKLLQEFREADYMAESRALIATLLRETLTKMEAKP